MTQKLSELTPEGAAVQRATAVLYAKRYYTTNGDRLRANAREYGKEQRRVNPGRSKAKDRADYLRNVVSHLFQGARLRAKRDGLPFEVTVGDIQSLIPADSCCPILRKPFEVGVGKPSPQSMSLDRVDPKLGYVAGNVTVISFLANTMKNNCTDPQLFRRWAEILRGLAP